MDYQLNSTVKRFLYSILFPPLGLLRGSIIQSTANGLDKASSKPSCSGRLFGNLFVKLPIMNQHPVLAHEVVVGDFAGAGFNFQIIDAGG